MENDLKAQFEAVLQAVKDGKVSLQPTQTQKLQLYGWYKQATEGDVQGEAPSGFDIVGKAKHAAWSRVKGMSKEEAMQNYIQFFGQ